VGRLYPRNITFQYTVQHGIQYRWELRDKWTACDEVCNGGGHGQSQSVRHSAAVESKQRVCGVCSNFMTRTLATILSVHNSYCAHLRKLEETANCNSTHWGFGICSQCSKTCGGGTQTRTAHGDSGHGWQKDESDCEQSDATMEEWLPGYRAE
jgi:hypothetical protein